MSKVKASRDLQVLGDIVTVDDDKVLYLENVTLSNGSLMDRVDVRMVYRDFQGNMVVYGGVLKMKQFLLRDEEEVDE